VGSKIIAFIITEDIPPQEDIFLEVIIHQFCLINLIINSKNLQ